MDFFFFHFGCCCNGHVALSEKLVTSISSPPCSHNKPFASLHTTRSLETSRAPFHLEINYDCRFSAELRRKPSAAARSGPIVAAKRPEPLKIMISRAPASGKGTQCELIKKKYGLAHIAAGDLLN